jgi:hypothetical protein
MMSVSDGAALSEGAALRAYYIRSGRIRPGAEGLATRLVGDWRFLPIDETGRLSAQRSIARRTGDLTFSQGTDSIHYSRRRAE